MANVNYFRKELQRYLNTYTIINDCINGEEVIKSKTTQYLPMPNPLDVSLENVNRYRQYIQRAVFYNVTAKTLNGLSGQIFQKQINKVIPEVLDNVKCGIDNYNVTLDEFAKKLVKEVISFGRAGILIDFPVTSGQITKAEIKEYNPILKFYPSVDVINWHTTCKNGENILDLVVIREYYQEIVNFNIYEGILWKVLTLENGEYWQTHYKSEATLIDPISLRISNINMNSISLNSLNIDNLSSNITENYTDRVNIFDDQNKIARYKVLDVDGNPFTEIQFEFIGSSNNDPNPDNPPLGDLAILNIGHYRNSADYEDAVFLCGQPIPVASGLHQQWVDEVLKDGVKIGSRAYVPLPVGGKFDLIQAQPNTLPFEAMRHKEEQMSALGAKLIQQGNVAKTAFEKSLESGSEVSILASIANNVSVAITNSLKKAIKYLSNSEEEIVYNLSDDFEILKMTSADRQQLLAEWTARTITWNEYRTGLKNAGVAYESDEEAKKEYDKNQLELQAQKDKEMEIKQKQKSGVISNQNNMQNK